MAKKKKSFMTPKASRRKARKRLATTTSRAKKEFTYRGYSVADLKEMPLWPSEESDSMSVIELLPARARRTIARGLSEENERLLDRIRRTSGRTVRTHRRDMVILPEFVGHIFMVHDGRNHQKVQITEDMVGHKLGEFAPTRTFRGHTNKKEGLKAGR